MKTGKTLLIALFGIFLIVSCKKNQCADCHYDGANGTEVELGDYCGDDLENIEADGYSDGTTMYEVHCGEGH